MAQLASVHTTSLWVVTSTPFGGMLVVATEASAQNRISGPIIKLSQTVTSFSIVSHVGANLLLSVCADWDNRVYFEASLSQIKSDHTFAIMSLYYGGIVDGGAAHCW